MHPDRILCLIIAYFAFQCWIGFSIAKSSTPDDDDDDLY